MGNMYTDKDNQIFGDFNQVFGTEAGKRVLQWMEFHFKVRLTLEPEEAVNNSIEFNGSEPNVFPIDPIALAKRRGLQVAYWKLITMVEESERLKERKSVE